MSFVVRKMDSHWSGHLVRLDLILRDQYLRPLSSVEVRLRHKDLGWLGSCFTDIDGRIERDSTPVGDYQLQILHPDLPLTECSFILVSKDYDDDDPYFTVEIPSSQLIIKGVFFPHQRTVEPPDDARIYMIRLGSLEDVSFTVAEAKSGFEFPSPVPHGRYQFILTQDGVSFSCMFDHHRREYLTILFTSEDGKS